MPWTTITLNDGTSIPNIAFGTWTLGNGRTPIDQVDQAIETGFDHIDTAQSYRNELEVGIALQETGLKREDVYITTKYSGLNGLDIETSIQNSLKNLGVKYVDLYLIHHPRLAVPDIPTAWAQMEKVKAAGFAKSIGVSNFGVKELEILLASAKVKPVANQIMFHPYVYESQMPIVEYGNQHGIVSEGYSALIPITRMPGGPLDLPLGQIAKRLNASWDQILLAWVKSKGLIAVTSSTKKERLEGYLSAGDIQLTDDEIAAIDAAGIAGGRGKKTRALLKRVSVPLLGCLLYAAVRGARAFGYL